MYDFLFVIIELFSLALTVETLQAKSVDVSDSAIFEGGESLRLPILGGRGRSPPTTVGWQKTRRIALSCGIKILPVGSSDSSQSMHVTEGRTYRQNYDSQDSTSIAASRGKNGINGSFTFQKSKLHIIYLNLLRNFELKDPFHHFHSMFQQ